MGRHISRTLYTVCAALVTTAAIITTAVPAASAAPTSESTAPQAATTAGDAYCEASFLVFASWPGGRAANLTVQNTSNVPVRWERIILTPPNPAWSIQPMNATITRGGPAWIIVPSPDKGTLPPGYSAIVALFLTSNHLASPPRYEVVCTPV